MEAAVQPEQIRLDLLVLQGAGCGFVELLCFNLHRVAFALVQSSPSNGI